MISRINLDVVIVVVIDGHPSIMRPSDYLIIARQIVTTWLMKPEAETDIVKMLEDLDRIPRDVRHDEAMQRAAKGPHPQVTDPKGDHTSNAAIDTNKKLRGRKKKKGTAATAETPQEGKGKGFMQRG